MVNIVKQGPEHESTFEQFSCAFEWLHFKVSYPDSNVRTTLYGIKDSTTGKYCSVAFIWMDTL